MAVRNGACEARDEHELSISLLCKGSAAGDDARYLCRGKCMKYLLYGQSWLQELQSVVHNLALS